MILHSICLSLSQFLLTLTHRCIQSRGKGRMGRKEGGGRGVGEEEWGWGGGRMEWRAAAAAAAAKSLQSCPTLCDPIDGSPSGSPVPGILQARTLEWVAIAFSAHSLFQPPIYCVCVVSPECLFCLKKENRQFSVSLPNFNNIWRQYDKVDVL